MSTERQLMARIQIRRATTDDATAISALTSQLALRHIVPDCSAEGAAKLIASMDVAATDARLREDHRAWVAVDTDARPDAPIAVLVLRPPRHLYHLFVADAWQGQGLARKLWNEARTVLLAEGAAAVTVNAARHAVAIYERLGFIHHGPASAGDGVPSVPMYWLPAGRGEHAAAAGGCRQGDCAD